MFEFQALCKQVEALTPAERAALIAEKSASVAVGLRALDEESDPVSVLAAFVVGSVVADGSISEKDYLNLYPSLAEAFGELCDVAGIGRKLKVSKDIRKDIALYTKQLLAILGEADEQLYADIVLLCLLVTSVDGKVSPRERRYIKQLCR